MLNTNRKGRAGSLSMAGRNVRTKLRRVVVAGKHKVYALSTVAAVASTALFFLSRHGTGRV
jgi:hypothetical protein